MSWTGSTCSLEAAARLDRRLDAVTAEVLRSLSPASPTSSASSPGLTQPTLPGQAKDLPLENDSLLLVASPAIQPSISGPCGLSPSP